MSSIFSRCSRNNQAIEGLPEAEIPLDSDISAIEEAQMREDIGGEDLWADDDFYSSDEEEEGRRRGVLPVEMEEYEAALHIQRMARGFLYRRVVNARRIAFNAAAKHIQRITRGKQARERVAVLRKQLVGVLSVQRLFRGHMARLRVAQIKRDREMDRAATEWQRVWRGAIGRERMRVRRLLENTTVVAERSAEELTEPMLTDLAALDQAPPQLLTLLQSIALLMAPIGEEAVKVGAGVLDDEETEDLPRKSRAGAEGRDVDGRLSLLLSRKYNASYVNRMIPPTEAQAQSSVAVMSMQWGALRELIVSPHFLKRLRRLARFARGMKLVLPRSRVAAVLTCMEDPEVGFKGMLALPRGMDAAFGLLNFAKVRTCECPSVF